MIWSVAYVWDPKHAWIDKPRTYASLLVEFIRTRSPKDSFIVAVHKCIPTNLVEAFKNAAPGRVRIETVEGHPYLPTASRLIPLLDILPHTKDQTVVVADVHDYMPSQTALLRRILRHCTTASFTCWPAETLGTAQHPCILHARIPISSKRPDVYHWHIDAGLCASQEAFRTSVGACAGVTFRKFLAKFCERHSFARSVDEVVFEKYLTIPAMQSTIRDARFYVHKSWRRDPGDMLRISCQKPVYAPIHPFKNIALEPECEHSEVKETGELNF